MGFSPTLDTVDPMLLPSENPIKCHEEVLSLRPMIPPKRFDIFPPSGGCSEGLDASRPFFKQLDAAYGMTAFCRKVYPSYELRLEQSSSLFTVCRLRAKPFTKSTAFTCPSEYSSQQQHTYLVSCEQYVTVRATLLSITAHLRKDSASARIRATTVS